MENTKVKVVADLAVIDLQVTKEELSKIADFRPDLLVLKDDKGNETFRIAYGGNNLTKYGAVASKESNTGTLVIVVPLCGSDNEERFRFFAREYKQALETLDEMIGTIKIATRGIDGEIEVLRRSIEVLDGAPINTADEIPVA
jgi:hypothetical protein